jgi:hypothetical protein
VTTTRSVAIAAALTVAVGGCALWSSPPRPSPLLERADRLAQDGSWEGAVVAYGDYLNQHPTGPSARRAATNRDTLRALLSARTELVRLREELARLREDVSRRDGELVRVRQETDRLKADLERLKQVDLKLERRK